MNRIMFFIILTMCRGRCHYLYLQMPRGTDASWNKVFQTGNGTARFSAKYPSGAASFS